MVAAVPAKKGPKRTPPLSAEERHKRAMEKSKRRLLNSHIHLIHNPFYEFHNMDVSQAELETNVNRLYKFLEDRHAKVEAELDKKYSPEELLKKYRTDE